MPAPTALRKEKAASPAEVPLPEPDHDEEQLLDAPSASTELLVPVAAETDAGADAEMVMDEESRPRFPAAKDVEALPRRETRKIRIPPHRMTPYVLEASVAMAARVWYWGTCSFLTVRNST